MSREINEMIEGIKRSIEEAIQMDPVLADQPTKSLIMGLTTMIVSLTKRVEKLEAMVQKNE